MTKSSVKFILSVFFLWRGGLFIILYLAVHNMPYNPTFLGGGSYNYLQNPYFWAFGNYDGQHYVNIAQNGYGYGEFTFFPLYPLLIKIASFLTGPGLFEANLIGQVLSNLSFLAALIGFYNLARMDLNQKATKLAVILLVVFPTSFYFAAVYTESLFLALLVWAYYFFRKGYIFKASMLGLFLAMLRPVGVFIFPVFLLEWYLINFKPAGTKKNIKIPFNTALIPFGLGIYMVYLKSKIGDSLAFFNSQQLVGEHRSRSVILFPQIIYRYIFKIFPNLNWHYFPVIFFTLLEFTIGAGYFVLVIAMFWMVRPGYALFSLLSYLMPTLLGSFSSMPRYVLIIFPVYLILASRLQDKKYQLFAFIFISFILLVISFSLFARGFWIS
jgi:hypothetical protein